MLSSHRTNTPANMKISLVFCVLVIMWQESSAHPSCSFRFRLMSAVETMLNGQLATCRSQPRMTTTTAAPTTSTTPGTDQLRFVNGLTNQEGRVETFHNETWGTICDDHFTARAGQLACNLMDFQSNRVWVYPGPESYFPHPHKFGSGTGPIWLDEVECIGSEQFLDECTSEDWLDNNCHHSEDVGVVCHLNIRLVDEGNNPRQGRVEIEMNGVWGTVCDSQFDDVDAAVVCSMMGYSVSGAQAVTAAGFGKGSGPIYFGDLDCTGNETSIEHCPGNHVGHTDCCHAMDAGVICQPVPIRLVDGAHSAEGRVEIYFQETWGSVCDDYFSETEAGVVCAMLGFSRSGAQGLKNARFGESSGPIHLDDVTCIGTEDSILQCSSIAPGEHDCRHYEDVGVICQTE